MPAAKPSAIRPMQSTASISEDQDRGGDHQQRPRRRRPRRARRSAAGAPCRPRPRSRRARRSARPLPRGRRCRRAPGRPPRAAPITQIAASDVPGGLALLVAEPEHQQRDDDGAAADAEQPAEGARRRWRSRRGATSRGRHRGAYYGRCPLPPQTRSRRRSRPLTADPPRAAVFCDIDGTLAPIVERAEDAHVREEASLLLGRLARRYGCVACVSGRSAAEARRLVGVGGIAYAGSHGAELLEPGAASPRIDPGVQELGGARAALRRRARQPASCAGCACGSRTRGRSPPSTGAACPTRRPPATCARGARPGGRGRRARDPLGPQGAGDAAAGPDRQGPGRARPGERRRRARRAVRRRRRHRPRRLRRARRAASRRARSTRRVRVGVALGRGARRRSSSAPTWWWTACDGFTQRAGGAGRVVRFRDFLRIAVLLFGGAATALAVVSVVGAAGEDDQHARLRGARLVVLAAAGRALAGPRRRDHAGHRRAARRRARHQHAARARARHGAVQPAVAAGVLAVGSAALGFFFPQVPAIAAGYAPARGARCGASSRARSRRSRAATACEFWIDRSSPFGAPQLLRLPGPAQDRAGA